MPRQPSRVLAALLVSCLLPGLSFAQAPPGGKPSPPAAPPEEETPAAAEPAAPDGRDESKKAEAEEHFRKGLSLYREEAWAAALAEFLISRRLYPTRAATNNAAICLRRLKRFDESLDMFEALLREFPQMPAEEKTAAQRAVAELRGLVGTIDVRGAEPGAAIVIDGQSRAEYPPVSPIRVAAGSHVVRVFKEGFEPFEQRVDVAGGATVTVTAKLPRLTRSGKLKVVEQGGRSLDVVVDGVVVGKTPWEGSLAVGKHAVFLRGPGKLGTQPALAPISPQETTALTLRAEPLDASMRIDARPPGASIALDGIPVGRGYWAGRLRGGAHRVEIAMEGFLPQTRDVSLPRGGREIVQIDLKRDPDADIWRKPSKWTTELDASFIVAPSFGGALTQDCGPGCSASPVLGALGLLHVGYELGSGIGFGLLGGGLFAGQSIEGREGELSPNGLPAASGAVVDELSVGAGLAGASAWARFGDKVPTTFRLGAGVFFGRVRDERRGSFEARSGEPFEASPAEATARATYLFVQPEARVSYKLSKRLELGASVKLMMLVAAQQPTWNESIEVDAGPDGLGRYPGEPLLGDFVMLVAPGANVRYDF